MGKIATGNHVKAIRADLSYDTAGLADGVKIGTLPAGAQITSYRIAIITPFNASGNDLIKSGVAAGNIEFAVNIDVGQAATVIDVGARANAVAITVDRDVYVNYDYTGTAPTAGRIIVVMEYIEGASLTSI